LSFVFNYGSIAFTFNTEGHMAQQFTTVHTYRAPLTSGSTCGKGTRLFAGTPSTGYAVDTFATCTAMKGARVYRPANVNAAVLWVDDRSGGSTHLMLAPEALRELAGRLLDAAQDIEQTPAAALAAQAEEVTA
jgi:hypothetical protein